MKTTIDIIRFKIGNNTKTLQQLQRSVECVGILTNRRLFILSIETEDENLGKLNESYGDMIINIFGDVGNCFNKLVYEIKAGNSSEFNISILSEYDYDFWKEESDKNFSHYVKYIY